MEPKNPQTEQSPTSFMPEEIQNTPINEDTPPAPVTGAPDPTQVEIPGEPDDETFAQPAPADADDGEETVQESVASTVPKEPEAGDAEDDLDDDGFDLAPVVSDDPRYTGVAAELREGVPYGPQILELIARLVSNCGIDVRRFMEMGCGDAVLADIVLKAFPSCSGVLLDVDEPSLSTAWEKLGESNKRMAFVSQDVAAVDWAESVTSIAPFDLIVSAFVLDQQADEHKVDVYADIFELLGPGGVFLNLDYVSIAAPFARGVHDTLVIESLAALRKQKGTGDPAAAQADYANRPDKPFLFPSQTDVQCEWLREIGFVGVDCFFRELGVALFGGAKPLRPSTGNAE